MVEILVNIIRNYHTDRAELVQFVLQNIHKPLDDATCDEWKEFTLFSLIKEVMKRSH